MILLVAAEAQREGDGWAGINVCRFGVAFVLFVHVIVVGSGGLAHGPRDSRWYEITLTLGCRLMCMYM